MWKAIKIIFLVGFIGIAGILVMGSVVGNDNEEERKALLERHCQIVWDEINQEEKEKTLQEFINENGIEPENRKSIGMVAYDLLRRSVKYPETILIDGEEAQYSIYFSRGEGNISDVDSGLITFHKNFTAKNKLNMDVRMQMQMDVKYTAGCENFEVVDFRVE